MHVKTLRVRVKGNTRWLDKLAGNVNFVWNYCNDLSYYMVMNNGRFLSKYDIQSYLIGSSSDLGLYQQTVQLVGHEYTTRRKQAKARKLKFRGRKSLGWVPFSKQDAPKIKGSHLVFGKHKFKVWDSYGLEDYAFRAGSFNQDSKGNWFLNIAVEVQEEPSTGTGSVGIDLGLKTFATMSNGETIESKQFYRELEPKLQIASRAKKKNRVKAIHQKIANRRKDFLHKASSKLVAENTAIFVGNVNSSQLAKTKMAKSVLDAGWGTFRIMLESKAIRRQVLFQVIDEAYTSRTCSACNSRTGPQGLGGLGIREWTCSDCGSVHDRDVNAATNILALGLQRLAEGNSNVV